MWNDHPMEIVAAGRFAPAEDGAAQYVEDMIVASMPSQSARPIPPRGI